MVQQSIQPTLNPTPLTYVRDCVYPCDNVSRVDVNNSTGFPTSFISSLFLISVCRTKSLFIQVSKCVARLFPFYTSPSPNEHSNNFSAVYGRPLSSS